MNLKNKFASASYIKVKQTILSAEPHQKETVEKMLELFLYSTAPQEEKNQIVEYFNNKTWTTNYQA